MSRPSTAIVITSINKPNYIMEAFSKVAQSASWELIVIGDRKSPSEYVLPGSSFFSVAAQKELGFRYAELCPEGHYCRKNIGYLVAMHKNAEVIIDTDDDNRPLANFELQRERNVFAKQLTNRGWVNVYQYFTDALIWPRGLPLDAIRDKTTEFDLVCSAWVDCPIQQGLADGDPDVDAIYRFLFPEEVQFNQSRSIALGEKAWSPFNSQNTTWWSVAFPMLYLPATCSFRMTDIWRSFIAQRIAWCNNWCVLYTGPTVYQERNPHQLIKDFSDEIAGYLHNRSIARELEVLNLREGEIYIQENIRTCYEKLVQLELLAEAELDLLDAWLADVATII